MTYSGGIPVKNRRDAQSGRQQEDVSVDEEQDCDVGRPPVPHVVNFLPKQSEVLIYDQYFRKKNDGVRRQRGARQRK